MHVDEHDTDEGLLAVVGHRLLNVMSVVVGVAETLYIHEEDMSSARRLELLALMGREAHEMSLVLQDLVRGLPAGSTASLGLSRSHGTAHWWEKHEDVRLRGERPVVNLATERRSAGPASSLGAAPAVPRA